MVISSQLSGFPPTFVAFIVLLLLTGICALALLWSRSVASTTSLSFTDSAKLLLGDNSRYLGSNQPLPLLKVFQTDEPSSIEPATDRFMNAVTNYVAEVTDSFSASEYVDAGTQSIEKSFAAISGENVLPQSIAEGSLIVSIKEDTYEKTWDSMDRSNVLTNLMLWALARE